jgi:predicted RNA-binding Zn-ribbon protein involved in translation (DUF1610 family)
MSVKNKMQKSEKFMENFCPNCRGGRLKSWEDLTPDEKFIFERMPVSAEFSAEERNTHLFCPRCMFETKSFEEKV